MATCSAMNLCVSPVGVRHMWVDNVARYSVCGANAAVHGAPVTVDRLCTTVKRSPP